MVLSFSAIQAQNTSTMFQTGTENSAVVSQIGKFNDSFIDQKGSKNLAAVQQGGFGDDANPSNNAKAIIRQVGSLNNASISQKQGSVDGNAVSQHEAIQNGRENFVKCIHDVLSR